MIRYQIRNEYGLSDPELYAPGEKDDPEALLEGVAMAGLVGVLRQLGDLAEFAAEIFHDLHEDVMATASRGHGLMLRLQQLEAEFPAVEKAIISQTDHSNYPHDNGVEWHANLQLNQNMITRGDMPRFILDSYEECRGPPHLFTLDKFDVAGAGASLKRYSDPSFFKTEHASDMTEIDAVIEKKPRKIKKKTLRWRKGETLESLLVANSESHTASKDRTSRKVPPRTTKLKYRYPQGSDHKTMSRMCREHLLEVISSQQKILSNYSLRHYHAKFRSTDSSEMASSFGELDNSTARAQPSAKLELTKVVPIDEYDTLVTTSTPINGSACLEADDGQLQVTQHGPDKVEGVCKRSPVEQNAIFSNSDKLQGDQDIVGDGSNCVLQSMQEENLLLPVVCADQDVDRCWPDDTGSDQENFIDALNNMESEGKEDIEMKIKTDLLANMELDELNFNKESENEICTQFPEQDHVIDSSPMLNDACGGGEPICVESFLLSDSYPVVSTTKHPDTESVSSNRKLSGVDCTSDEEPFNDVDLMDVSSSSSVHSDDNGNFGANGNINGFEQYQEAFLSNDYHAMIAQKSSDLDGSSIDSNHCIEKAFHSVEDDQNFAPDGTSRILGKPNDVTQNGKEIEVGNADYSLLHPAISNQEVQKSNKQFEDLSLHASASPGKNALLNPVIVANTAPTGLSTDYIHEHVDDFDSGVAPTNSSMQNNPLYESQDDEIVEELHSLPEDLYKHVVEDDGIIVVAKGPCSTRANTHLEDPMQASVVPRDFSNVHDLPELTGTVSHRQEENNDEKEEYHANKILAPSSCELNDEKKPSLVDVPLTCSNASLLDNSTSCLEHDKSTETGKFVKSNEILVDVEFAEESTNGRFADDMVPFEDDFADGAKYSEKTEFVVTNPREENSRHDVQLQSNSPCRNELDTVEPPCKSLGPLDESREHSFEKSVSQTDNLPQHIEIEKSGEACSDIDDIQYLSVSRSPTIPVCQDELQEETSLGAEVPYKYYLEKDGAITLNSNMAGEQPANIDQDLAREPSDQDSFSTNPFMDPGYKASHTLTDPCPSVSYQPCFSEEEQDFISELLIQHGDMGTAEDLNSGADSLWEPATPPDEVPLPSEFMTEEDFRSFCHEYHEMDFTAAPEDFDDKPPPDSNNVSNSFVTSESEILYLISAELTGLNQGEAYVCSKLETKLEECSSAGDAPGDTPMPIYSKESPDDETPDSDFKSDEPFTDKKIPELCVPSVPIKLEVEQRAFPGVDSHGDSQLLENDKTRDTCSSPSGNIIPVKEKQETCANLVSNAFINERIDELDISQSNSVLVEKAEEVRDLDEYNHPDVSWSLTNEKRDEVDAHLLSKPVQTQGSGTLVLGELDSHAVPSFSVNEMIDYLDVPPLSTVLEAKQEPEDCISDEHNSQITESSLINEKDELDSASPLSNALLVEIEQEVCAPGEPASQIAPCSSANEKSDGLNIPPLSSSVLIELESENVSGDLDSQIIPCSSVNNRTDESDAATLTHVLPVEIEQEVCSSPELVSQIASCSLNGDKVCEQDGPPCKQLESEKGYYCSPEVDRQVALRLSNSVVLGETSTLSCTNAMPSTEETYRLSPVPPPSEPLPNVSYEDPQKPPPLPPLQWRLGKPRLGTVSTQGHTPELLRRTSPVLHASNLEMGNMPDSIKESIEPVSSQEIKERDQDSILDTNNQGVELRRLSSPSTLTDVTRTEHVQLLLKTCENIKHQECMPSSETEAEEHQNGTEIMDGMNLHPPLFLVPIEHAIIQQGPQGSIFPSDTSVDSHNVACPLDLYTPSSSAPGHVRENGCNQQPQHGESLSACSVDKEHTLDASCEKNLKDHLIASEAHSHGTNCSAPGLLSEERNIQNVENQCEGPLSSEESSGSVGYPHDDHNSEKEEIHQPDRYSANPGNNNYVNSPNEGDYAHAEQPPVMGWTVGPQMLHPNYGISVEENQFEPKVADHRPIKKPISIRNIPRNPLVDAVAAHDRSTMRKVSELVPPTTKPKPDERNLLLEQIRNKTFNLKPVGSAKPTTIRAPARTSTKNLKVAAIIEKAIAIRQAVGSDDEDGDNWSDS
ncbi:hypothetical protein ABZP36_006240 [Zizania latifolia]